MSWGYGKITVRDGVEMEVGYTVDATCESDGCEEQIDRGLAYRCGGTDFDAGCGHYFCGSHMCISATTQLCSRCIELELCWRCGVAVYALPPSEPICDDCYDAVTEAQP